jgi:phosphate transport system substrate-binding protein
MGKEQVIRQLPTGLAALATLMLAACGGSGGASRDFVRAVGSSTVYPFATAVAEQFARNAPGGARKSPVIESTGTGAGMKLFCGGIGAAFPDIEDASRRIKPGEYADCVKHGVKDIVEVQVGIDGIAFAEGTQGPGFALTPADIYRAIAAQPFGKPNTARLWSDVNPALPAVPILVYGPPTTSGTRDAMADLILAVGCKTDPAMAALEKANPDRFAKTCKEVREDGAYVDSGENDNLIVQKLAQNPKAVGIFGYSFLEENPGKLKGIPLAGVAPTYETISSYKYPGARPLFIYVKKQHLAAIRGLKDYVTEWSRAWGPDGYLKKRGMVIAPDAVRANSARIVAAMTPLDPRSLAAK